jgi:hypothetical protein
MVPMENIREVLSVLAGGCFYKGIVWADGVNS